MWSFILCIFVFFVHMTLKLAHFGRLQIVVLYVSENWATMEIYLPSKG